MNVEGSYEGLSSTKVAGAVSIPGLSNPFKKKKDPKDPNSVTQKVAYKTSGPDHKTEYKTSFTGPASALLQSGALPGMLHTPPTRTRSPSPRPTEEREFDDPFETAPDQQHPYHRLAQASERLKAEENLPAAVRSRLAASGRSTPLEGSGRNSPVPSSHKMGSMAPPPPYEPGPAPPHPMAGEYAAAPSTGVAVAALPYPMEQQAAPLAFPTPMPVAPVASLPNPVMVAASPLQVIPPVPAGYVQVQAAYPPPPTPAAEAPTASAPTLPGGIKLPPSITLTTAREERGPTRPPIYPDVGCSLSEWATGPTHYRENRSLPYVEPFKATPGQLLTLQYRPSQRRPFGLTPSALPGGDVNKYQAPKEPPLFPLPPLLARLMEPHDSHCCCNNCLRGTPLPAALIADLAAQALPLTATANPLQDRRPPNVSEEKWTHGHLPYVWLPVEGGQHELWPKYRAFLLAISSLEYWTEGMKRAWLCLCFRSSVDATQHSTFRDLLRAHDMIYQHGHPEWRPPPDPEPLGRTHSSRRRAGRLLGPINQGPLTDVHACLPVHLQDTTTNHALALLLQVEEPPTTLSNPRTMDDWRGLKEWLLDRQPTLSIFLPLAAERERKEFYQHNLLDLDVTQLDQWMEVDSGPYAQTPFPPKVVEDYFVCGLTDAAFSYLAHGLIISPHRDELFCRLVLPPSFFGPGTCASRLMVQRQTAWAYINRPFNRLELPYFYNNALGWAENGVHPQNGKQFDLPKPDRPAPRPARVVLSTAVGQFRNLAKEPALLRAERRKLQKKKGEAAGATGDGEPSATDQEG